jgi:hypothetical protein
MKKVLGLLLALALAPHVVLQAQTPTQVISRGRASTANASTTPLGSGATFTGTWEDTRDYNIVSVSVFANQNSASSGWKLQWSSDASNVDVEDLYTVTASTGQSQTSVNKARYFRTVYINGGSAQATFRLATVFRQSGTTPGSSGAFTGLTDTQLRASAVPISGTVTANVGSGTQPVSGTVTVTDGAGALNVIVDSGSLTANAGTNLNTSALALDATLTGGTQKTKLVDTGGTNVASVSAGGALKVDNSGVTQPVSGTVTTTPPANASTNLAQVVGTAADVNSGNKSAGTLRVVLATDQPALTNKLLVTPDSVALPANQSTNVAQVAGTTTDTNSGVKSAGTLRVVLATDQPALTNKLLVTPDSVALPANQSVNAAQIGGTNTVNGGLAGSLAVGGTAGNNAAITQNPFVLALEARSSAPTAATNGNQIRSAGDLAGNQFNVYPLTWSCALDNIAATLTECKAAAPAGYSYYVTGVFAQSTTATAATFAIRSGTGTNCGTGTAGILPGATTTRTYVLPANTAAAFQFSSTTGVKATAAHAICAIGAATNTLNITIMGYTAP